MNHAWLGLIFPTALLIIFWGHFTILPAVYGSTPISERGRFSKFIERALEYDGSSGVILIPYYLLSIPVLILGCIFGFYERQTGNIGIRWICRAVAALGLILGYALVMYVASGS